MKILPTTEAVVEGGRSGHGRTVDGRLAVQLSVPTEMGGVKTRELGELHADTT